MTEKVKIGVFDSGVGGLTVLKELVKLIPQADYLYFGDTARLPYGSKSVQTVARYATGAAQFLELQDIELLVVACNSATALALDAITRAVTIPVIGVVDPGAEHASEASQSRHVVVIGTEATISSHAYKRALTIRGVSAHEKACPLLVPLIEEGWVDHPVAEQIARIYLEEAFQNAAKSSDTLVLGCTHYPLLKTVLRRILPAEVAIIDSAESTAQVVAKTLGVCPDYSATEEHGTRIRSFVTDSVEKFRRLGERFLGHPLEDVRHVDLGG